MMLQGASAATDYLRAANDGTLTMAMIETPTALKNVAEIAGTPGIDCLFIGPYDLATSLSGGKAQDILAPEVERAVDEICAAAVKAGKIPAIYCRDAERALAMAKRGFKFIAVHSDLNLLRDGTAAIAEGVEGLANSGGQLIQHSGDGNQATITKSAVAQCRNCTATP